MMTAPRVVETLPANPLESGVQVGWEAIDLISRFRLNGSTLDQYPGSHGVNWPTSEPEEAETLNLPNTQLVQYLDLAV